MFGRDSYRCTKKETNIFLVRFLHKQNDDGNNNNNNNNKGVSFTCDACVVSMRPGVGGFVFNTTRVMAIVAVPMVDHHTGQMVPMCWTFVFFSTAIVVVVVVFPAHHVRRKIQIDQRKMDVSFDFSPPSPVVGHFQAFEMHHQYLRGGNDFDLFRGWFQPHKWTWRISRANRGNRGNRARTERGISILNCVYEPIHETLTSYSSPWRSLRTTVLERNPGS